MYPANGDTQGAFIVQESHLREIREEIDARRLAQEVSQGQAADSTRGRTGKFALLLLNAVGNRLAARIIQSRSNPLRPASIARPADVQTAGLLK